MTDQKSPTGSETEFEMAARLATEALGHAHRHHSPPRPNVYEVWYTYAAGADKVLRERVDTKLKQSGEVDLGTLEQIHDEHFLQKHLSRGITRISEDLDSGLEDALGLIRDGVGSSRAYMASLEKAQGQIGKASRNHDAKRVVMQLLEINRNHATQSEAVGTELARTRAQVVDLKRELGKLRESAYLDHLTQIANRRHMDEVLEREIAQARSNATPLAFALGDLDHFKVLNDTWGHPVGDAMLKHFAMLIRKNIKGQDTAARFGGEEFAIIFPKTSAFGAGHISDRIRQLLYDTEFVLSRDRTPIGKTTVSFGVAQLMPGDNLKDLIERADKLLYAAKAKGRNRVETDM